MLSSAEGGGVGGVRVEAVPVVVDVDDVDVDVDVDVAGLTGVSAEICLTFLVDFPDSITCIIIFWSSEGRERIFEMYSERLSQVSSTAMQIKLRSEFNTSSSKSSSSSSSSTLERRREFERDSIRVRGE